MSGTVLGDHPAPTAQSLARDAHLPERRFAGACQFPVADSRAQVLRIQLPRDTRADYNDDKFRST